MDYSSTNLTKHTVYYGSAGAVIERTITSDIQGMDISAGPTISFLVASATYTFSYYYPFPPDSGVRSGSITTSDGRTLTCTDRDATAASLSGLSFVCRSRQRRSCGRSYRAYAKRQSRCKVRTMQVPGYIRSFCAKFKFICTKFCFRNVRF